METAERMDRGLYCRAYQQGEEHRSQPDLPAECEPDQERGSLDEGSQQPQRAPGPEVEAHHQPVTGPGPSLAVRYRPLPSPTKAIPSTTNARRPTMLPAPERAGS